MRPRVITPDARAREFAARAIAERPTSGLAHAVAAIGENASAEAIDAACGYVRPSLGMCDDCAETVGTTVLTQSGHEMCADCARAAFEAISAAVSS